MNFEICVHRSYLVSCLHSQFPSIPDFLPNNTFNSIATLLIPSQMSLFPSFSKLSQVLGMSVVSPEGDKKKKEAKAEPEAQRLSMKSCLQDDWQFSRGMHERLSCVPKIRHLLGNCRSNQYKYADGPRK